MAKDSISPPGLAEPLGPYAHVTRATLGELICCSGAVALDGNGEVVGRGDIAAQMHQVMQNLETALASAGATFADVVKITNYVTDASRYKEIAPIREQYLQPPYPASTLIEVKSLLFPDFLVEVEALAVVSADS